MSGPPLDLLCLWLGPNVARTIYGEGPPNFFSLFPPAPPPDGHFPFSILEGGGGSEKNGHYFPFSSDIELYLRSLT